jgi:copper(I)-binding protein
MHPRSRLAPILLAAALPLTACSQDAPLAEPGAEVRGGAVGPDTAVTADISLLQVQIEYPLDGRYEQGEDARLFFAIANTGDRPDTLVAVTGPDFAAARTEGAADGGSFAIAVPEDDNVYVGAEGEPAVVLEELRRSLRSSQSIPVTFVFAEAGEVTLDAMVAAAGQDPTPTVDFPDPAEDPTGDS